MSARKHALRPQAPPARGTEMCARFHLITSHHYRKRIYVHMCVACRPPRHREPLMSKRPFYPLPRSPRFQVFLVNA